MASCGCGTRPDAESPSEIAPSASGETYGQGTILDGYIATRGEVTNVAADGVHITIVVEDADYPGLKIELEAGHRSLFAGIAVGWNVYVSFSVSHTLESAGDKPTKVAATAYTCFIISRTDAQESDLALLLKKYESKKKHDATELMKGVTFAKLLANAVRALAEELQFGPSPICFYAIYRAAGDPLVIAKLDELLDRYYVPYETDCIPGMGPGNRGVVNVVFRLRSYWDQTETALVFPVRLRTWNSVDRTTMYDAVAGFDPRPIEVMATRVCSWSCRKCRYAVEAARAACTATCTAATSGIGAAVCILACNIAADERKANC